MIWERSPYRISDDPRAVDVTAVHEILTRSYWARGIPRDTVARAIAHSLPFSLLLGDRQVGFARAVTDRATFAYLADVFVIEEQRGRGLGEWLVETVLAIRRPFSRATTPTSTRARLDASMSWPGKGGRG